MSSTNQNAGSGATGTISGFSGVAWSNPGNITASDDSYATVVLSDTNTTSESLEATNFGFNLPLHSTVDGIICTFERKASAADTIRENHVYLIHNNSLLGDNKITAPAYWSTTEGDVSYGSPSDQWGATLNSTLINDSSFGVLIDAQYYSAYSGTETAYVDRVYITVYYTLNFMCGWGSNTISAIKYGTTSVAKVYYGSTRVA